MTFSRPYGITPPEKACIAIWIANNRQYRNLNCDIILTERIGIVNRKFRKIRSIYCQTDGISNYLQILQKYYTYRQ